jgi:hypothetical protein
MPKPAITITDIFRRISEDIPLAFTIVERKSVKKVKLAINPVTTPMGRDLPESFPPMVEDKTIGRIGKIQGERIVTTPAKNAKAISKIIFII